MALIKTYGNVSERTEKITNIRLFTSLIVSETVEGLEKHPLDKYHDIGKCYKNVPDIKVFPHKFRVSLWSNI